MKLTSFFVLSLGLSFGSAFAEESDESTYTGRYLACGLSEENGVITGWYDAEKTKEADIDDPMCYAASAANLLAWWYDSGKAVASDAPTELNDIWSTFKSNNQQDEGGTAFCAINWWLSGVYAPCSQQDDMTWVIAPENDPLWERSYLNPIDFDAPTGIPVTLPNYQKDGADFSGYYYDQYGLTKEDVSTFLFEAWSYSDPTTPDETDGTITPGEIEGPPSICEVDFVEILEDSAISLGIFSDEGNLGHAITLWGVEYDEDGNLTTLWLTDSDDYINQLFSAAVTLDEEANKIYFGELVGEGEDAYYYFDEYENYKNIYIGEILALNTEEALKWQLVPEPTTATLSLLALVSLAARRRRK